MTEATRHLVPPRADGEELDPELLELPDPPKRERTLTVAMLIFTALASIGMILALRRDAAYAFSAPTATELGDLGKAPAAALVENQFVHGTAALGAAHAIRYERPLVSESFRLMPVLGRSNVWVEVRVPPGQENVRFVPPAEFRGRLIRFDAGGPKRRGLANAIRGATGQSVPSEAWLLVDGESPGSSRWAILLVLLFGGFAVWNVLVTAKLLRKVK